MKISLILFIALFSIANSLEENTTKLLLIGNSLTYYNGMGQMISKLAKSTSKKLLVCRATKAKLGATELVKEVLDYYCWFSYSKPSINGTGLLSDIANKDFGGFGRPGKWDYIILQNNNKASSIVTGDTLVYKMVGNMVNSSKNFIVTATHYGESNLQNRLKYHQNFAKQFRCSIINSGKIIIDFPNWKKELTIQDSNLHTSGKGAYMYALINYAKIFGIDEFPKKIEDDKFIKLYNDEGNTTKQFAGNNYKTGVNTTISSMSVTKKEAKKLQVYVAENYKDVNYY